VTFALIGVGKLGEAGPPHDRIAPRAPVPGRSAVVDEHDGVPVIHPGLRRRGEAVLVVRFRPAVDVEQGRVWAGTVGCHDEAVDLARDDVAIPPATGHVAGIPREDALAVERHEGPRPFRGAERAPDRAVGSDRRPVDAAGRRVQTRECVAVEVVAVQLAAAPMVVPQEQRLRAGVPRRLDLAGQVDRDRPLQSGLRVPDERAPGPVALVSDDDSLIARDRAPAHRAQSAARTVPQLRDRHPRAIEDPERAVARIAVLAVRHDEELLVGGERADGGGLAMGVEAPRSALRRQVDGRALVAGAPDDREAGPDRRVRRVRRREIGGRACRAALERLHPPQPELAPAVVIPPPGLVALWIDARRHAVAGALGARGEPALDARREIERVDLERAFVIRAVHEALGTLAGPVRDPEPGRAEALLPGRLGHVASLATITGRRERR